GQEQAERAKEWLSGEHPRQFHFTIETDDLIPWGLVFDTDPTDFRGQADDIEPEQYRHFWALKYRQTTMRHRIAPNYPQDCIHRESLQVLPVINEKVLRDTLRALSAEEQVAVEALITTTGPVHSTGELFRRWAGLDKRYCLMYIVAHANPTTVALGEED